MSDIRIGDSVIRGPHWHYDDQDVDSEFVCAGIVVAVGSKLFDDFNVKVRWHNGLILYYRHTPTIQEIVKVSSDDDRLQIKEALVVDLLDSSVRSRTASLVWSNFDRNGSGYEFIMTLAETVRSRMPGFCDSRGEKLFAYDGRKYKNYGISIHADGIIDVYSLDKEDKEYTVRRNTANNGWSLYERCSIASDIALVDRMARIQRMESNINRHLCRGKQSFSNESSPCFAMRTRRAWSRELKRRIEAKTNAAKLCVQPDHIDYV